MKTKIFTTLVLSLFFIASPFLTFAQDDEPKEEYVVVVMNDGSERVGIVISDDGREILLRTHSMGDVYIPKSDIKAIKKGNQKEILESEEMNNGDYSASGPFTTRYYFTTNALPVKKNENYAMVNLYGPEVHFAVSDNFSLGLMSSWWGSPMILAAKYTIPTANEKVNFGLGTLMGSSGYLNNFRGFGGLHWGMVTFGDRVRNITLSAGYSYLNPGGNGFNELVPGTYTSNGSGGYDIPYEKRNNNISAPIFSIAGSAQVGKKATFFVDNMLLFSSISDVNVEYFADKAVVTEEKISATLFFLMPGMRFQTKPNRAFQFALAGVMVNDGEYTYSFPLPMVSWLFKF